jgi:hypothetical protein
MGKCHGNIEGLATLIKKAKEDPKFFHSLIWETEKAVSTLDFLNRDEKAAILRINPEDLIVDLATGNLGGASGLAANCGGSCGVSCGGSCGVSCGVSCATSCATSSLITDPTNAIRPEDLTSRIESGLANARFNRFSRY